MHDASQAVDPQDVYRLVAGALDRLEEPAEIRGDGVWLRHWPSVHIALDYGSVFRSTDERGVWTAWIDLTCTYNPALPFTAARSHVIGLGMSATDAVSDAVEVWRKGVVPPLLSYIYGVLVADAESWPDDHPSAVPGWSSINGAYVLRGDPKSVDALAAFVSEHPLIGAVRERLAAAMDPGAPFHTVSLYRAQTAAGNFADLLIDARPDPEAGELLKRMPWPDTLSGAGFVSARQFLLCIASGEAHSAVCPGGPGAATHPHPQKPRHSLARLLPAIAFAFFAAAGGYFLHEGLVRYSATLAREAGPATFTLVPSPTFWLVPSAVLGVLFAAALVAAVTVQDTGLAHGWRGPVVRLVGGGAAIAVFFAVLAYFAAHSRLQLTDSEIVLRRLWSFTAERYPYSRVSALIEDGDPGDRGTTFSIHFRDAPVWSTRQEVIFPGVAEKDYLAARTGLAIQRSPAP